MIYSRNLPKQISLKMILTFYVTTSVLPMGALDHSLVPISQINY